MPDLHTALNYALWIIWSSAVFKWADVPAECAFYSQRGWNNGSFPSSLHYTESNLLKTLKEVIMIETLWFTSFMSLKKKKMWCLLLWIVKPPTVSVFCFGTVDISHLVVHVCHRAHASTSTFLSFGQKFTGVLDVNGEKGLTAWFLYWQWLNLFLLEAITMIRSDAEVVSAPGSRFRSADGFPPPAPQSKSMQVMINGN